MEQLYAPWRLAYVQAIGQPQGCFLCADALPGDDVARLVLARGKACFVVLNRYPYNPGHLLVSPLAHKGNLSEFSTDEMLELMTLARDMQGLLDRVLKPHGYNMGVNLGRTAGQGVPGHFHLHVVPRWGGDTNFLPVVGATKSISEALEDLCKRLREALEAG